MKISLITPAFNEEKLISASLAAIRDATAAFTDLNWQTELIVCDNNSTDRTAELARAAGTTVVFEPVNQIARARNRGAEAASGDWLIFIDADSRPSRELFKEVAEAICGGKYLFGGASVKMEGGKLLGRAGTAIWVMISRIWTYAAGCFIFCDATAFRKIGGFNLELFASEEIDLSRRLKTLARARGKRGIILHRHPMRTSSRRVYMYPKREMLGFIFRAALSPRRMVRDQKACHYWYDGKR